MTPPAQNTRIAPMGLLNEAIATLDHIGRPDLGTAVKDLWREVAALEAPDEQ